MVSAMRALRSAPLSIAAALYAWCTVIVLTVLIQWGTLVLVIPPALVATAPVVLRTGREPLVTAIAAGLLTLWAFVGITLLGSYFLPSAILLAVAYTRMRSTHQAKKQPGLG